MLNILALFTGGGCGALMRYLTCILFMKYFPVNLPLSTFFVNIAGSLLIGFLYVFFIDKQDLNPAVKLALTAGFCGGLTTFSTFSLELFEMVKSAQFLNALLYVLISVILGIIAVMIGAGIAKFCI